MEETENLYSSSNGDISFNCHNGYVYVCDHGLKKISLTNKEERKISSKDCSSCYIVDDKWVYFVDYNSALWRVTQDGTDLNKMYG